MHWLHWFCFLSHFTSPNLHFAGSKSRDVFLQYLHIWHKLGIQTEVEDETSCCLVCCCYHYYYHLHLDLVNAESSLANMAISGVSERNNDRFIHREKSCSLKNYLISSITWLHHYIMQQWKMIGKYGKLSWRNARLILI